MKRERVSGSRYIHPALVEHTSTLAGALRNLDKQRATIFLAVVLYNASPELIGKQLQMPPHRVRASFIKAASMLRHPSSAIELQRLAYEVGAFDASALVDDELRTLIRQWRLAAMFEALCAACARPIPVRVVSILQPRPGRPRRYCSNACRQKAYRARRKR
ncbi:hypothetical protein [Streptomyces sp. E2N166]|uniref:hypothetical protein n=1 Tax=Streptomyces sp. E2N166 TaxID=1851909 RepID=UPI000EF6FEBF|nr:hypothetical protein [Streptomyces sp. E2N166]